MNAYFYLALAACALSLLFVWCCCMAGAREDLLRQRALARATSPDRDGLRLVARHAPLEKSERDRHRTAGRPARYASGLDGNHFI